VSDLAQKRRREFALKFKACWYALALAAITMAGGAFAQAVQPVPGAGPNLAMAQYNGFGIHQPQGLDAVTYIYSANGTWRSYTNLINIQPTTTSPVPTYAYYCSWTGAVPNQLPVGVWGSSACPTAPPCQGSTFGAPVCNLIQYANDTYATSVPGANDQSLWQLSYQAPGTPTGVSGQAFEDNSGHGVNGVSISPPREFSQFWFDDNWLARYMSVAYGAPQPVGLYAATNFKRWAIVGGGTSNWTPYASPGSYIDELSLNGMYDYYTGNYSAAYSNLVSALQDAGSTYDSPNQQYKYPSPSVSANYYYLGFMKILTDLLLESGQFSGSNLSALIQQSVSLRSNILTLQQIQSGVPIGWVTSSDPKALINIETTSLMTLALSTAAKYTFEPGLPPTSSNCTTCFQRPYNVLSAVVGSTTPNEYMTYGPYINLPVGSYTVEFYLRTGSSPSGNIANLDVYDANAGQVLGALAVSGTSMPTGDLWTRISLPVNITNAMNQMEFRVYWNGTMNLDISAIRVH